MISYKAQDHFGLDKEDISKLKFSSIGFSGFGLYFKGIKSSRLDPFSPTLARK